MNSQSRTFQRLGGLGIVYSVLFGAALVLTGSQPATGASSASVVRYYRSHRVADIAAVFAMALAAIVFMFFLTSLRRTLGVTTRGRHLAPIVTAGGAVYTGGLLLMGALLMALLDAAHDGMSGAAQTLNVLSSDAWVPVVAGLSMVALGTGIAAGRGSALPRWLAWASLGLGILAIAGPLGGVAFLITPLWTLAVGIVLFRSPGIDALSETAGTDAAAAASIPAAAPAAAER